MFADIRIVGENQLIEEVGFRGILVSRGKVQTQGVGEQWRARLKTTSQNHNGTVAVQVDVLLEQALLGGRQLRQEAAAQLPAERTTEKALALRLAGDVVDELAIRMRLYYDPPRDVVVALGSTNKEVRLEAIDACAERKLESCTEALIALLQKDDLEVRDRAVNALGRMGDRRAVKPLTEVSKFGALDELPKIVDAVANIGGPEARAYLEFVATGHDRKEIRELARGLLDKLGR